MILAAFYGLRRSEAVGLKWDAIDFAQKTITIRHTVTGELVKPGYITQHFSRFFASNHAELVRRNVFGQ